MNPGQYLDTLGVWEATAAIPEQFEAVISENGLTKLRFGDGLQGARLPEGAAAIHSVYLFGAGSSGTVGDAAVAQMARVGTVPACSSHGPEVPAAVGPGSLLFAVSLSGDDEDIEAATVSALERGAAVVIVSPDGALAKLARSADLPHLRVPDVGPASRAAMPSALAAVLLALSGLGLIEEVQPSLRAATSVLQRRRDALLAPGNAADELARRIGRTIPLVYGAGVAGVAARHWKRRFNENVKTPAFCGVVPDVGHDEVSGWGQHGDITRQVLTLLPLRHQGEHPLVAQRYELVLEAVDEVMACVLPVWAEGSDDLSRFCDLVLFGDFVSLYLAGREGIDPGPLAAQPLGD